MGPRAPIGMSRSVALRTTSYESHLIQGGVCSEGVLLYLPQGAVVNDAHLNALESALVGG